MKKIIILVLCVILQITCFAHVIAESSEEWLCPSCGAAATGNFCSTCGEKRPEDGAWTCPNCSTECTGNFCSNCGAKRSDAKAKIEENEGKIRLDLSIAFEKNAYFSTYDVKVFVDDEWITTMRHGIDYAGSVYVTPGKHAILFEEASSSYPSTGSTIINISEPSLYQCEIHAKIDMVQITNERTNTISDDRTAPDEQSVISVDGNIELQVSVEFRKNGIFSQYDVDMYFDDIFIAALPHGKNYEGTLLVSKGTHMITFYKSGSKKVRGTCIFTVDHDAYFSCKIEAERNKIEITNDKLSK